MPTCSAGVADIRHGAIEKGFRLAQHGMERMIAERLPSLTAWCVVFAGGCVKAHRPEEGLATLAGIAEEVETGERWTAGEFHRLRGLLRLQVRRQRRAASTTSPRRSGLPCNRARSWSSAAPPPISSGWRKAS